MRKKLLLVILGGFVFCFYAFYNNYPFLFPDTGAYLYFGFKDGIPYDRPKTYGLFLRHISLGEITWLVILVQGIILSTLIHFITKYFVPKWTLLPLPFFVIVFLTLFTGVSITTSTLMPDIFMPIFLLAFALLLIVPIKSKRDKYLLYFFLWLGIIMHNSHVITGIGLLCLLTIFSIFSKTINFKRNRLVNCWIIICLSALSIPSIHYITDGEFVFSKASHVFVMSHFVEIGLIDDFLEKNCSNNEYGLCKYQNKIPTDFIWDYKRSPLHLEYRKGNAWEDSEEEYNKIIKEIISTPKYLKIILYKSLIYTTKQFFSFDTSISNPQLKKSSPQQHINKFYLYEKREAPIAMQQRRHQLIAFDKINMYQKILFFASACFYVFVFFVPSIKERLSNHKNLLLLFILTALIANAFVCSNFSTIVPRYQSRIIWLLPLTVSLCLIELSYNFFQQKGFLKRLSKFFS